MVLVMGLFSTFIMIAILKEDKTIKELRKIPPKVSGTHTPQFQSINRKLFNFYNSKPSFSAK